MVDPARETELKFTLDPTQARDILAWLGQGRRPTTESLVSTYFDTADHPLRRAGYSLRVREEAGARIQTVKSQAAADGRLGRGEWSCPVAGPGPDLKAARLTPAEAVLSARARLRPLFTVAVERQALDLRTPDGLIEACLDTGAVEAAGRSAPVIELELELKAGPPDILFALARRLQETFPVALSAVTKADRGFALAAGQALTPRHFQPPKLTAEMSAGDAFRAMARAAVDQIVWNAALVGETPSPEAIHQARVGVRRLRTALSMFKAVVDDTGRRGIRARLKTLAGALDSARNLDVFIDGTLQRARSSGAHANAEPGLLAARDAAYHRARTALSDHDRRTLALDTLAWIDHGPWTVQNAAAAKERDRPAPRFARRRLEKGRRRLIAAGRHLRRLDAPARHKVRIQAKNLRYAADVVDQLYRDGPRRARRFLAALEGLGEALGELNDMANARVLVADLPNGADLLTGEAARERHLLSAAKAAFKAFKAARPYWR